VVPPPGRRGLASWRLRTRSDGMRP
jgi:hypothetical protein